MGETAEERTRKAIDALLESADWDVQDRDELNLDRSVGVAVRDFPLKVGFVDYMLFVGGKAVGVIEAKSEVAALSGVSEQTEKCLRNLLDDTPRVADVLPFAYENTGAETVFRDMRDPDFHSHRVFGGHKPETLKKWLEQPFQAATKAQAENHHESEQKRIQRFGEPGKAKHIRKQSSLKVLFIGIALLVTGVFLAYRVTIWFLDAKPDLEPDVTFAIYCLIFLFYS